jgi:glycosyltransferase involved in cell wall biosynthesis
MNSINEAKKSNYKFFSAIHEKYNPEELIITIIVDCYYGLNLVKESVQSILGQSYSNVELMLIDNGAHDDVSEYLGDIYLNSNNTALVKFSENQFSWEDSERRVAICWNAGLLNCRGDVVGHINYDDVVSSNYAYKMAKIFSQNKNCVTAGPLPVSIDINTNININMSRELVIHNKRPRYISGKAVALDYVQGSPMRYFSAPGGILLAKKDILIKAGGYDREWDYTQIIKLAIYGDCGFDAEAKLYWRHHAGQLNKALTKTGTAWCGLMKKVMKAEGILDLWRSKFSRKEVRFLEKNMHNMIQNEAILTAMGYIRNKDIRIFFNFIFNVVRKCSFKTFLYILAHIPREFFQMLFEKTISRFVK